MEYGFGAVLARMNYIDRWGLMRNARRESLSEHSLMTAEIAHILSTIAVSLFNADVNPDRVACRAMYHDACEIMTGDLPTPVKYRNDMIKTEYKKLEAEAQQRLLDTLPEPLRSMMTAPITADDLNERESKIVKAADKLSALIKCIEEQSSGNSEFVSARRTIEKALDETDLPELKFYREKFIPAYSLTLDELLG